ncbi:hypothetical protein M0804_002678 [Polistes exclamans]|nr:hypothetical protein M0804_002678 [Polistes exclamans]
MNKREIYNKDPLSFSFTIPTSSALASRRDSKHCKSESCLVECDKLMVSLLRPREAPIENTSPVMSTKSDQSEWPLLRLATDVSDTSEAAAVIAVIAVIAVTAAAATTTTQ